MRNPLILLQFCGLLVLASCAGEQEPLIYSFFALDTINQVQFYPEANHDYEKLADLAKQQVFQTEQWFNPYDRTSSISQLNQSGQATLPREIIGVFEEAFRLASVADGRYDPTIGPLVKLWDIGGDFPKVPAQEEIDKLLPLIGYQQVILDRKNATVSLKMAGMAIDLGSIAKGYAADRILLTLEQNKVEAALINLGGNILLLGNKPNGQPWRLGLRSGVEGDVSMELVLRSPLAISTAGINERYFEQDGKKYHHILSPFTGYPVENDLASVTVLNHGSSMTTDALSTILFILGVEEGLALAAAEEVEAIFVRKDFGVLTSSGVGLTADSDIQIVHFAPNYQLISQEGE